MPLPWEGVLNQDYHSSIGEGSDYAQQQAWNQIMRWAQGQTGVNPDAPTSLDPGRADFDRRIGQATNYNAQRGIAIVAGPYGPQQVPMTRAEAERAGLPWSSNSGFSFDGGPGGGGTSPGSGAPSGATGPTGAPGSPGGFNLGGTPSNFGTAGGNFGQTGAFGLDGATAGVYGGTSPTGFGLTGVGAGSGATALAPTAATAPSWYQAALEAAQQYYEPVAGAASAFGGGGGGRGGGGNGGTLTGQIAPPPQDYSQSPQYQQGLQNLLSVLGIGGSPMTWSGFNGAR